MIYSELPVTILFIWLYTSSFTLRVGLSERHSVYGISNNTFVHIGLNQCAYFLSCFKLFVVILSLLLYVENWEG